MAASSSLSSGGRWNYDVFLSFRGQDTRKIFVGHLHKALDLKAINAFIDSEDLCKGNDLSELLRAIEDSRLSIVVFSQNYASSTWCLKELVKILECVAAKKQVVVPIFYEVDPSDIRKLKGSFAEAFARHEQDYNANMEEVNRWKIALTEATNLSGWDSRNYKDDAKFIEKIVEDISEKFVHISSNKVNDLVGMDSHVEKMCSLLCLGGDDVRVVGVCGMPGIGKTTIAKAVYDKLLCQFEHYCFLENVKDGFKNNGAIHMQEELLSRIFEKRVRCLGTLSKGSKMIMERLSKKKVLLVLDDVENFAQIEALLGNQHSFGGGSRIIVTTRDIQSLSGVDARYSPMFLSDDEALELFMQYAFRTNQPTREYDPLSRRAVEYAQGLPLALKVLGAFLDDKSICEWEDELEKIKEIPHIEIQGVLKKSFDGLDPSQKDIFLDIACFFRGMDKGFVTKILESCGFYPHSGLRVLIDRALVIISDDNRLEMHDLIKDMGWEIIRQQSIKEPGKRSRLWVYEDVARVLTQNMATDAVECIMLDLSKSKDVYIDAEAFVRMTKLRLLRIGYNHSIDLNAKDFQSKQLHHPRGECKQHVSGDVKFLSHDLRYLMWYGCPLKSLPSNFHPKNLVDLDMRCSHIEHLWAEIKSFKKLKFINLSHSYYLTTTPNFTEATNVETLVLEGCSSLLDVNSSISALKNLVFLCLRGCKELKSLPSSICLKSLKTLDLSGCSSLAKFPEISGIMEDLSEIYLNDTAIEELPSSIERLQGLVLLHLRNCRSLLCLPDTICNLVYLKDLTVSGCSKLYHLPENLGNLESLMCLEVEGSGIRELPVSILCLKRLKTLSCDGCTEMTMPFSSWSSSIEEYCSYSGLLHLDLSDSNLCELSDGIAQLSSLKTLELRGTNLESLPATMNQLRCLTRLELEACKRLKSVPELPSTINYIDAHDCSALATVAKPNTRCSMNLCFTFSNCLQMVQTNLFRDIVETHSSYQGNYQRPLSFNMSLPGSEIPDWFNYQCRGSSLTVQLPPNWFDNKFLGFAICAVSDFKVSHNDASDLSALCHCGLKGNHGQYSFSFTLLDWGFTTERILESDHMFLAYVPWSEYRFIVEGKLVNERYFTEATFEIVVENRADSHVFGTVKNHHCITSCGVRFFHSSCMEEQNLNISETKSHHDSCDSRRGKEGVGVQLEVNPALVILPEEAFSRCEWSPKADQSSISTSEVSMEDQRNSYKRRKNSESWTGVSPTVEDGQAWKTFGQKEIPNAPYPREGLARWSQQVRVTPDIRLDEGSLDDGFSWRKYGQKDILGAKYPRGYYRCTNRNIQGCLATKQVQRADEDPMIVKITYQGRHTCTQAASVTVNSPPA
ncbi:putative transcription factor WRKY family [Rosa chinensis]|uniref:ADP-ribosyl cyclase/cyclic ADP-ribose hydrolase n=1 Tax=Rosa chinensis TaxID=74649 RepID=A0A2P6SLT3_ROSCH|nr:TMV resistance protein N [Rosa chinensis]PRQ59647.1 putative transcription factor WRKY family [Rosa chinensis]